MERMRDWLIVASVFPPLAFVRDYIFLWIVGFSSRVQSLANWSGIAYGLLFDVQRSVSVLINNLGFETQL